MANVTWIKEMGNGSVCYGTIPDGAFDTETCILVPDQPSMSHRWDNVAKEWKLTLESKQSEIRALRNPEISRTDKYILSDLYAKFSEAEKLEIIVYRQELRDAPNKSTIEELVMPTCPDCIKP